MCDGHDVKVKEEKREQKNVTHLPYMEVTCCSVHCYRKLLAGVCHVGFSSCSVALILQIH